MLQMLNKTNPVMSQLQPLFNMVKASRNPQAMLSQIAQTNPQLRQTLDFVNRSGGDPKSAFYKMAEEKGVNPEDILSMLR